MKESKITSLGARTVQGLLLLAIGLAVSMRGFAGSDVKPFPWIVSHPAVSMAAWKIEKQMRSNSDYTNGRIRSLKKKCPEANRAAQLIFSRLMQVPELFSLKMAQPRMEIIVDCALGVDDTGTDAESFIVLGGGLFKYLSNDDELAYIIAHEIVHAGRADFEKNVQAMFVDPSYAVTSYEVENHADAFGLDIAIAGGFDAYSALSAIATTDKRSSDDDGKNRLHGKPRVDLISQEIEKRSPVRRIPNLSAQFLKAKREIVGNH